MRLVLFPSTDTLAAEGPASVCVWPETLLANWPHGPVPVELAVDHTGDARCDRLPQPRGVCLRVTTVTISPPPVPFSEYRS